KKAVTPLLDKLESKKDEEINFLIIEALGAMDERRALPAIVTELTQDETEKSGKAETIRTVIAAEIIKLQTANH
ncbi:MAG: hypothetical protein WCG51_07425, partial [Elusimicrobiota bacterium]